MKLRFNTFDVVCGISELQCLIGMRVNQVYDVDNKTYLIRLQSGEQKSVLLLESGIRFHTTAFEWPKNVAPSGFSMKLRKHLKNKRLEKLAQIGADRIVDLQFGSDEAAYHLILELFDRGNIIITDFEYTILNLVRPHTEGENIRFNVRETYPLGRARLVSVMPTEAQLREIIENAEAGTDLRNILMPLLDCGSTVIDHMLIKHKIDNYVIAAKEGSEKAANQTEQKTGKKRRNKNVNSQPFNIDQHLQPLMAVLKDIFEMLEMARKSVSKGYIIQKREEKPSSKDGDVEYFHQNIEYQPFPFLQYQDKPIVEYDSFMLAIDEFYSTLESQKIDMKSLKLEREAYKKLSNVKTDHAKRLEELNKLQLDDKRKGELITYNLEKVNRAIAVMRSAIASQMSWRDIGDLVKAAQTRGDGIARSIKQIHLEINHISMQLSDPYVSSDSEDTNTKTKNTNTEKSTMLVAIDLGLSAWANARRYYDEKRYAAQKEQKTIDASEKALKSAEKKIQQTLKDVQTITNISKARKVYWFEKFYWFISSENYLVIGGRDAQQNDLIVKRYMRPTDIYVHAEIQGAASVIIRNAGGKDVPPRTLLEAGTMAISYSVAWNAKVATNAYWVYSNQVSKTAPTGEFLGTGSFIIRGKKNFLPSCHLIMGLSLLFKLEESFVESHAGERKVRNIFDEEIEAEQQMNALTLIDKELLDGIQEEEEIATDAVDEAKDEFAFPDTEVKIEHNTREFDANVYLRSLSSANKPDSNEEVTETAIIVPAPARKKQQQNYKKRKEEKIQNWKKYQQKRNEADDDRAAGELKRGQKAKGREPIKKSVKRNETDQQLQTVQAKDENNELNENEIPEVEQTESSKPKPLKPVDDADAEEVENLAANVDADILDSLTGQPFENDELLFVIPVVAPYQALQNYKYKVKLTPGTGKRGHAAKTALTMFSKDKACTKREKDLLKSIKEDALVRNIPGKVKISAPQLQKHKKKHN